MKVLPFKIPKHDQDAFVFQIDKGVSLYDKLHQHEEIQLSLIVEGEGTLIVGDTINYYNKGDILAIGSNIPHVFKSDIKASKLSHMITLFFTKASFGSDFFDLDELAELQLFFNRSAHGFKVISKQNKIKKLFEQLEEATKFNRFLILLQLLKCMSIANYKSLSSFIYNKKYTDNEGRKIRNVFEYTMTHFQKDIDLETIAEVANMSKNAFCKYFKKRTNKTYFKFLTELRIEHACKLIKTKSDYSISEIAYQSGFKNISNFNRHFKSIKYMTPTSYKAKSKTS